MTTRTAVEATARLSEVSGRAHRLVGPLAGGETGATLVRDDEGRSLVLKWEADPGSQARRREGVVLTERLRTAAAWPVPRQTTWDDGTWLLVTQELMAGEPVDRIGHGLVDDLLAAHHRRIGLAEPTDPDRWGSDLITTLTTGGEGYCLHQPLRDHDARTRAVVERIEALGAALDPADLGGGDVVHWDLHPGNLLQVDGRLAAVVDCDFAKVGDGAFDLVALAVSSLAAEAEPGVRSPARRRPPSTALTTPGAAPTWATCCCGSSTGPSARGARTRSTRWLDHADRLLDDRRA